MRLLALIVPVTLTAGGIACARGPMGNPIPEQSRFAKEWDRYLTLPGAKAMALAGDVEITFTMGYAWGLEDDEAAIERARVECIVRRALRNLEPQCRIHAVGNRVLDPTESSAPPLDDGPSVPTLEE